MVHIANGLEECEASKKVAHSSSVPLAVETSGLMRFEDHSGGSAQERVSLPARIHEGQIDQDGRMSTYVLSIQTRIKSKEEACDLQCESHCKSVLSDDGRLLGLCKCIIRKVDSSQSGSTDEHNVPISASDCLNGTRSAKRSALNSDVANAHSEAPVVNGTNFSELSVAGTAESLRCHAEYISFSVKLNREAKNLPTAFCSNKVEVAKRFLNPIM